MLAKLMKYDLKATSRLLVPLYLILLVMSVINRFVFRLGEQDGIVGIIGQFFVFTYIITIFVVIVVTVIYMIIRFYKNLLTDEGYLMFTLPAKTHQHITSKLLITIFWTVASIVVILISLFIAFATPEFLPDIADVIRQAAVEFHREFGVSGALMIIEMIIMALLGLTANILLIYVSIAIGQLFSKHKIIGSFAAYMIIYTVLQFAVLIIFIPFGIFMSNSQPEISILPKVIFPVVVVVLTVGSALFYAATNYLFKRKLNLD